MKPWYVGLPCRKCGQRVKQGDSGYFCFPLGAQPWAECGPCREEKNQGSIRTEPRIPEGYWEWTN